MTQYTQKELQRMEIRLQISEFLSRGGVVKKIEYGVSALADEPIKLTRKQQVEKMRGMRIRG